MNSRIVAVFFAFIMVLAIVEMTSAEGDQFSIDDAIAEYLMSLRRNNKWGFFDNAQLAPNKRSDEYTPLRFGWGRR